MLTLALTLSVELFARAQASQTNSVPHRKAFDFFLTKLSGESVPVYSLWSKKPVSIMIGSYTCPEFRKEVAGFDGLQKDFSNRVNFIVLYVQEAHPGTGPSPYRQGGGAAKQNERDNILLPQPKTALERAAQARLCAAALNIEVPILVDPMDNAAWEAFGRAPNSGFLIRAGGEVMEQEKWFNPTKMRAAINKLLDLR